jgi:hypothetical protein
MTHLRVEFFDGSSDAIIPIIEGSITNGFATESHATVRVFRDDWSEDVNPMLDKINDEFYIESDSTDIFGGRLVTATKGLSKVELEIGSFEEDAIDAEPTGPTEPRVGVSDQSIVQEGIGLVPTLSQGAIDELLPSSSFFFSNTSPAGVIRTAQRTTGAFVRYNPDKTVDYVEFPTGSASVATVGPDEGNVEGAFDVKENEREEFTHLTVLGASEGDTQISATGVVSNFSGGRERHRQFVDKSITNETRAQQLLDRYLEEYENDPVRIMVETTVFGEQLEVGSVVRAISTDDDLDANLFVIENKRILQGNQDVYEVRLSNRLLTEENDDAKQRLDIETFNKGFQGDVVTINSGGYRAPVDSGFPYRLSVRVPDDVVGELTAEVEVEGLPYRAYSSGAASGGGSVVSSADGGGVSDTTSDGGGVFQSETTEQNTDVERVKQVVQDTQFIRDTRFNDWERFTPFLDFSGDFDFILVNLLATSPENILQARINGSAGSDAFYPSETEGVVVNGTSSSFPDSSSSATIIVPYSEGSTTANTTCDLEFKAPSGDVDTNVQVTATWIGTHTHDVTINIPFHDHSFSIQDHVHNVNLPNHTHPPNPGITSFGQNTPSGVELFVNGNTVQTGIGSGVFTETVDIGGQLQTGFNEIELTSNSLGHLRATAFLDVYRQITQ